MAAGAVTVGEVQVDVNADYSKMLEGLNKAQAETRSYAGEAAKSFLTVNNAVGAAGLAFVAYSAKAELATIGLASMSKGITNLGVGLKNVLGLFGALGVATLKLAERNPRLATAATGALLGHPVLGVAAATLGTRVGTAAAGAAGFALRRPVAAAALGVGGGLLGIAAVGAAAAAGAAGFGALKDAFNEARSSSKQLQDQLESLKTAAEKMSEEMPAGSEAAGARLRRLQGVTGGLTSPFALLAGGGGQVSSKVIEESSDALEELTVRFGDHERAAQTLAQALQNPAKAMRLLREAGILFTADQRRLLEGTRSFEDRLKNAAKILEIINAQTPQIKKSGFVEFMSALGKFAGLAAGAPGAGLTAIGDFFKSIGAGLAHLTGLDRLLAQLDTGFQKLASSMSLINKRFFPAGAEEELEGIRAQITNVNDAIDKLNRGATSLGGVGGILNAITGGGVEGAARATLERNRARLQERAMGVELNEAARLAGEQLRQAELLNDKLQDNITARRDELNVMQAQNRVQLEAHRLAVEFGVPKDDPRIQTIARLNAQIEARRRAQAQSGQLTVYERENQQLTQQLQLFRYGNEEMEIRGRLLQVELQAAQRRQPLNEAQKNSLLEQMRLLKEVQRLTGVVNEAAAGLFNSMGDALAQFATTGKFNFKEFADNAVQQLVRIALQAFVIKPILDSISSFSNSLLGGAVAPGSTTTPITIPRAGGFASGGAFMVPGGGGGGDKPFLIGLSAGERVDVTPAGKANGGGGVTIVNNLNSSKEFDVTTTERQGQNGQRIVEQTFNEVMKKIGRGEGDGTFGQRYGMRPRTLQR